VTDASWPPNPYDYSTPASAEVFAGRLREVNAFKRFAAGVGQGAIEHLLIHGPRAIGKTSLLGRLDEQLDERSIIHARVTLDDGSAEDGKFLLEAITALTDGVIRSGGLGGPGGPFDQAFQDALAGGTQGNPQGPLRVLRFAAASGQGTARLPDLLVEKDLQELTDGGREVDSASLVLVVDEADRLEAHPVTVQRLRNLFITPGLVAIVLAGSDGLLTALDTAMAPMSRHFERLSLEALGDERETREAMTRPLQTVGIDYREVVTPDLVHEVHALSGGRPFEISLLCHAMYERLQSGETRTLTLSAQVLEAVAAQLKPSAEDQAALAVLRTLEPPIVRLAAAYCVDPQLTLHEHSLLRSAFVDPTPAAVQTARAAVSADWTEVERIGLAAVQGEFLRPAFGELGRLYLKYRARVVGAMSPDFEGRYSDRLASKLEVRLAEAIEHESLLAIFHRSRIALVAGADPNMVERLDALRAGRIDEAAFPPLTLDVEGADDPRYQRFVLAMVPFEIMEDGFSTIAVIGLTEDSRTRETDVLSTLTSAVAASAPYGVRPGVAASVELTQDQWQAWRRSERFWTAEFVVASLWLSGRHDSSLKLGEAFLRDLKSELEAQASFPESGISFLNNLGFVRLAAGHLVDALSSLEQAAVHGGISDTREVSDRMVLLCNLAAASAGLGSYTEALDWCDQVAGLELQTTETRSAAVLSVFTADPDWPKQPVLVRNVDPVLMALGTRASCQACLGDEAAVETAASLAARSSSGWARRVQRGIALRRGVEDFGGDQPAGRDHDDEMWEFDAPEERHAE
jgi:hypothetical protein